MTHSGTFFQALLQGDPPTETGYKIRNIAAYGIKHVRSVLVIIHTAGFTFPVNVKTEIILSFKSSVK